MDNTKTPYASFPLEWTVKSTFYQIRYRIAFNINEIDEIFCSIINANGNEINVADLGSLLGFNSQDLSEIDILNIYLKSIIEFKLITINKEVIHLTEFGEEALQSKLKYKYFFATTELFENQTATGEGYDFSFKNVFDLDNKSSRISEINSEICADFELKQKLQFQLFGNNIYKGEIIELYAGNSHISYKAITLLCETIALEKSFHLSIYKFDLVKPEVQSLIELPENVKLKEKLIREGMYHHILAYSNLITAKDIANYIDLWNWKELAENPKTDWNDSSVFNLFLENGDGSVWRIITENAPIESIKPVIQEYADYWNWTKLSERFDNSFIKEYIENFNWDFEELSYKNIDFVQSIITDKRIKYLDFWTDQIQNHRRNNDVIKQLAKRKNYELYELSSEQQFEIVEILTLESIKADGWDWNYLSKKLGDDFIENYIDEFPWDFYLITEVKSGILKKLLLKRAKNNAGYSKILLSKPWNWKFISNNFKEEFLYSQISTFAEKIDWHTILNRFFTNEEITAKCLKEESLRSLFKQHLPDNYVVAHQAYIWSLDLIDFFEENNLIQWETKDYINGFDTNENVEWNKTIFQKYHRRITTEKGYLNVSHRISEYSLIAEFPDFAWNWEGVSKNKNLIENLAFIENAFIGNFSFSSNLFWGEILSNSTFDISFWNKHLETFYNTTDSEQQNEFWKTLTQKEETEFVFANKHFPWDWSFVTVKCSEDIILDSYDDEELFEKWDWKVATRKLDKETILENLEDFERYVDWKFLINEVFTVENELAMDKQLPRIATCLSVIDIELRKDIWKDLTSKIPFELLFPLLDATNEFGVFEWDWDYISNHSFFPTAIATLDLFEQKINWSIFSENKAIRKKFNPKIDLESYKDWENNTDRYLSQFSDNWDWKVLSKNEYITSSLFFISKYKDKKWDWELLSEFGNFLTKQNKNNERYLVEKVVKQFQAYINFEFLSKRKGISISSILILSTKYKNWDWQILSVNENVEISNELIIELKDKSWDWQALAKRKTIDFNNEFALQLLDNDWDWTYLSNNTNLEFNAEFIEQTKEKPWDWNAVSRHKTFLPTIELLTLTKDFDLDWEYLSKHAGLNPNNELLAKFENKWHWDSITENSKTNLSDLELIGRFENKWNWHFICEAGKIELNECVLTKFKDRLDWTLISQNTNIGFTKEIIQEFKQYWNWPALKKNKRVEELLGNFVSEQINKSSILSFLDKIEQQRSEWKGSIYHFSHIDNAVEIIKNRNIKSRNTATIRGDAAGNVVHLRNDAHNYARFYFRPHTPTQFYNEFLGKNTTDGYDSNKYGWVSWYEKARGLGFPKCPTPIFFRFSLQEVLFKNEKQCCISNGNMQTGATQFGGIEKMINKFGFEDLYYTPKEFATKEDFNRYRNYAQQEFLVTDGLSFNDLIDFEIVCPSESDRALLINLLGIEHKGIFTNIVVDRSYYNNKNPRVRVDLEKSELHIKTEFCGQGYFVLNGTTKEIEILSGDVSKINNDKIIFKSNISLGNIKQNIRLEFIDESNRRWFIYET